MVLMKEVKIDKVNCTYPKKAYILYLYYEKKDGTTGLAPNVELYYSLPQIQATIEMMEDKEVK